MKIGPYTLSNRLVLAPMAGVTDQVYRKICRRYGAALAVSEMISSNPNLKENRKTLLRAHIEEDDEPRSVQILGNNPSDMAESARINVDRGAQIIDINMGCPAKKVCNKAAGSALMRDEELVKNILSAVVNAVQVPVTLKIRTGWDSNNRNALQIAKIAEDIGIQALTIHGRTRACGFSGSAEYRTIAEVKGSVKIPIVANGDIDSLEKARAVLETTGADAIMIGRASLGRPWIFREIDAPIKNGDPQFSPDLVEIKSVILEHLTELYSLYGEHSGLRIARKHVGWYLDKLPEHLNEKRSFNAANSVAEQLRILETAFNRMQLGLINE
jgi:tRNA-dihydrouridine synthase B